MQTKQNFLQLLLLSLLVAGTCTTPHAISAKAPRTLCGKSTLQKNGTPTKKLKKVFKLLGAPVKTLAEANEFAQKNLLRSGERWDKQTETDLHGVMLKNKAALLKALKELGMINAIHPAHTDYTYALLMGALKERVELRIDILAELIQKGYTFETIVLLGGARELRDEEKEGLPATVTTEAQMMAYLCAQHPLLKDYATILVNAPMIQKTDGTFTRPTTDSTLVHFAQIAPHDGTCLVISNNPYIVRQTMVTRRILDQSRFCTDGAGKEADEDTADIIMLMDEFARTVYEEFKLAQAK